MDGDGRRATMKFRFAGLQQLGRALMLPIAVLPIAGLLLRLGQPDLLHWSAMASAGDAVFSNLGLLFAVGVGVGLARENHGAAGLAALVGYLVTTRAVETMLAAPPGTLTKLSIPVGLLSGIIAGVGYNRFSNITLPSYLSFFGGRRFVPIVSGLAGLALAGVLYYAWPVLERGMDATSHAILSAGSFGLFAYGLLNRILIITGLHHILNNVAWFIVGDYHGVTGDLNRFFAGDPRAGAFMSGFFPVMMFGLPAACLAMYRTALPARRLAAGGLLLSMALTSFLTGVTEPIEFTFMFLAPGLFALHAVLTGLAMVTMDLLGIRLGFGFSAGLFDYALNFNKATHPWLLLPVGAAYALLYYGLFRYFIERFNLKTPGREAEESPAPSTAAAAGGGAERFIGALGGAANLREVAACTTRLRLVLADRERIDEAALRRLGARGFVRVGENGLQVVVGPVADQVTSDIRARLASPRAEAFPIERIVDALGGAGNVAKVEAAPGRVLVTLSDATKMDAARLRALLTRGIATPSPSSVHLLHASAENLAQE